MPDRASSDRTEEEGRFEASRRQRWAFSTGAVLVVAFWVLAVSVQRSGVAAALLVVFVALVASQAIGVFSVATASVAGVRIRNFPQAVVTVSWDDVQELRITHGMRGGLRCRITMVDGVKRRVSACSGIVGLATAAEPQTWLERQGSPLPLHFTPRRTGDHLYRHDTYLRCAG